MPEYGAHSSHAHEMNENWPTMDHADSRTEAKAMDTTATQISPHNVWTIPGWAIPD